MSLAAMLQPSPDVVLNVTTILLLINRLTPGDRALLYNQLGVTDEEGIIHLLGNQNTVSDASYEEQLMEYNDYRAHKELRRYVPPLLLFLGTVGNILSFVILMQRPMRKFSTYIYLAVLSVTDTLVLYVGLLRLWTQEISGHDIRNLNWVCKVINVIGYTVSDYSVWLIIAVTVERYIAVCHPLRAHSMCNRKRALTVISFLLCLMFTINLHFFWTADVVSYQHGDEMIEQCAGLDAFKTLVVDIWPWVDAIIYSFLPFVSILVLNALIIRQVIRARRHRTELQSSSVYREQKHARQQQESNYKLTVMLLTISFTFLLTTLPVNISLIATAFWNPYVKDLKVVAKFTLIRTITELLMYTNHSMNFFLYCATGQKFRQQLGWLLCRRFMRNPFGGNPVFRNNTTQHSRLSENGRNMRVEETELLALKDNRPPVDREKLLHLKSSMQMYETSHEYDLDAAHEL